MVDLFSIIHPANHPCQLDESNPVAFPSLGEIRGAGEIINTISTKLGEEIHN
jgi:hypothetical protein